MPLLWGMQRNRTVFYRRTVSFHYKPVQLFISALRLWVWQVYILIWQ